MNLQHCWTSYLKAEQLLEQGHWSAAQHMFEQVLQHMPHHIQTALEDEDTRPCQFSCLLSGLRDATVSQSEILNRMGEHEKAFELLNQSYTLLQFISIEPIPLVRNSSQSLCKHSEDLLRHMEAFCTAHTNTQWTREFEHAQKNQTYFKNLKQHSVLMPAATLIN